MFKKILCPVDFSPGSRRAMELAARMADRDGAELVLAHAWYEPPLGLAGAQPIPPDALVAMRHEARQALAGAARELRVARISTRFLDGMPWVSIVEALDDCSFDLVVVGTHGRSAVARLVLGSVTDKVVRHAPCSVLVVRPDWPIAPFDHVLCGVDFSDASRYAADIAVGMASKLTLVHVIQVSMSSRGDHFASGLAVEAEQRSTRSLDRWATELATATRIPIATRIDIGAPWRRLLAALDSEQRVSLVAVGSHGRTGLGRVLLGSVAEKLVRHAACPVLVARRRA